MNVSRRSPFPLLLVALAFGGGCYTAQLDPDLPGVFACGDDEEDEPCPASLVCVNDRCEDADAVPTLTVLLPEDEQSIMRNDVVDITMGMQPVPGTGVVAMTFRGNLELVPSDTGAEHVLGQGHVKVFVDGTEQRTIDSGSIDGSTPVMVNVPLVSGPHRILVQAYRNDGIAYDNPEATATRLFWFENEFSLRPFVAIKSPWPGTVIDVDDQEVEVVLAVTLPFQLVDPASAKIDGQGHGHVYYDPRLPPDDCVADLGCDGSYIGIVGESRSTVLELPEGAVGSGQLTVVLRHTDHSAYGIPFPCDPSSAGPLEICSPVFDTIDVVRGAD